MPFFFDDRPAIERNESIRTLWPPMQALQPPNTAAGAAGRPITNLSLAINFAMGGLEPRVYHEFNLGLHLGAALALWGCLRRTLRRIEPLRVSSEMLAATIALLWALHPLGTEAVVCVVQRNELLVTLFLLLTLYGFVRAAESISRARAWLAVSVATCTLGMASKEVMTGAPLLVLLFDRTFVAGSFAAAWRTRRYYYSALAGTWALLAWLVLHHEQRAGTAGFGLGTSGWAYLVTQCRALVLYLKLALWPHPLVVDYGFDVARSLGAVWPQALLVLALLAATAVALWRRSAWGFLGATFFVVLAPSSSFLPLTTQTIAEHRMYLPLAAVVVAVVLIVYRCVGRIAVALGGVAAIALGALTFARVEIFQSEAGLWTDTLAHQPTNPRAHASLAEVLARDGRWQEAATRYETALQLEPNYADAQNDFANVLAHLGRIDEALVHYAAAHRLKPDDDIIRYNFAVARAQAGQLDLAIADFRAILARDPRNAAVLNNLGDALLKTGRTAEALAQFEAALTADPNSAAASNNAGIALVALGRFAEAVRRYEQAVHLMPESAQLRHNFALALDGADRRRDAIVQEEIALKLAPDFAAAREHLAALHNAARP